MSTFGWNCPRCTYFHQFRAERCKMCGSLRVTRDQMRDFVAGKQLSRDTTKSGSHSSSCVVAQTNISGVDNGDRESDRKVNGLLQQNQKPVNPYMNRSASGHPSNASADNLSEAGPDPDNSRSASSEGRVNNPYDKKGEKSMSTSNDETRQDITTFQNITARNCSEASEHNTAASSRLNPYITRSPNRQNYSHGEENRMQTTVPENIYTAPKRITDKNEHNSFIGAGCESPCGKDYQQQYPSKGLELDQTNEQPPLPGYKQDINVFSESENRTTQSFSNGQVTNKQQHPPTRLDIAMNQGNRQHLNTGLDEQNISNQEQGTRNKPIAPLFKPTQRANCNKPTHQRSSLSKKSRPNVSKIQDKKSAWNEVLPYEQGPVPLSETTSHNWIYPIDDKYPERSYQLQMARASIMTNTLVSLPTGLGKTLIAAVVMYNYYRWFPTGKVVFCAPTRPLVTQQIKACYNIMGIPECHTAEISGRSKPDARKKMFETKRVFFCTPHTLVKDIADKRCNAREIVCVVMDEAHRATGSHANAQLIQMIKAAGAKFRMVGLSATPGTDIKAIQSIIDTLSICQIEAKTEDDPDVKQYIYHREEEVIIVKPPDAVTRIDKEIDKFIQPYIQHLRNKNVSSTIHQDKIKAFTVRLAHDQHLGRSNNDRRLDVYFHAVREMLSIKEKLHTHGILIARNKLQELRLYPKPYLGNWMKGDKFQTLLNEVSKATHTTQEDEEEAQEDLLRNNPKFEKLTEVLIEHFRRKQAAGQETRAIIFSQWRDSVEGIVSMLKAQNHHMLKPSPFIGQSKKAVGKKSKARDAELNLAQDLAGMNQVQQQRVLEQFREGFFNILVCTCVAEEGLDIGDVDLIVNFDVLKSPIRSIQRSGRTGRKRNGRVVFLISEGAEQRAYYTSIANAKKITRVLQSSRSTFKFIRIASMFPVEPKLIRQKMTKTNFRMSQVGGHTPTGKRNSKYAQTNKTSNTDWMLTISQNNDRRRQFGDLPNFSSRGFDNSYCFPQSLRRNYLKSRERSVATQLYRRDGISKHTPTVASCLNFLKALERKYFPVTKNHSLSPLDEALAKLQSTKNCEADYISLHSVMSSVHGGSFEIENQVSSPRAVTNCDRSPIDTTSGIKRSVDAPGISTSQQSFLFDSHADEDCAPPLGYEIRVSTDNLSTSSKSILAGDKKIIAVEQPITADAQRDSSCCNESDLRASRENIGQSIELNAVRLKNIESEASCMIHDSNTSIIYQQNNFENSDANINVHENEPEVLSYQSKHENNNIEINQRAGEDPTFHGDALASEELVSSLQCEEAGDVIVALQLPTPPDSSDESDNESINDDISHKECIHRSETVLNSSIVNETEIYESQVLLEMHNESSNAFRVDENDIAANIAPLQLPTQFSSSSSDDSSDDETPCNYPFQEKSVDEDRLVADQMDELERDNESPIKMPEEFPTNFNFEETDNTRRMVLKAEDQIHNDIVFDNIVPLQLPTQDYSSSDDDGSNEGASKTYEHNNAAESAARDSDMFIDLCDENDDDVSCKKMHPPPSLTNLGNATNSFSCSDDLVDTPVPKNAKIKDPTSYMSPDDLTDTPVGEPRNQVLRLRLSDGLTDTPLKTTENDNGLKQLARRRKRLRTATGGKENLEALTTATTDRQERVKKRIEEKYRCRFLDTEAALDGSGEDSDEEDAIKKIEEDESNNSFINDSSQLGYTQDDLDELNADEKVREVINPDDSLLHRQLNHQQSVAEQFKTPVFNRRMMRTSLSQNVHSSQRGLGNMNFIKSILEHHRQGGDSNDIEDEYHRLVGDMSPENDNHTDSPTSSADSPVRQLNRLLTNEQPAHSAASKENHISHQTSQHSSVFPTATTLPQTANQISILTSEQKAMIEAKRAAALKRRQEHMQQPTKSNPYAK